VSQKGGSAYGIRNLLDLVPLTRTIASSPALRQIVEPILGSEVRVVRGIFFDKTATANWKVPWHQDLTIAVTERVDLADYGPWSLKAGVIHVQPPTAILERMLTVRIHLDDTDASNGALKVIPGSHTAGRLSPAAVESWRSIGNITICPVDRGGAMLMRPLLLHSSAAALVPQHRRVLHFEYAAATLPAPLTWHE
jgi:ectoine hydroxylase-related dioxygenase (phytanoyl-CoA dioxygenase family)